MWVRIETRMPDDPAVDGLSDGAFRLYVAALCHCQEHLTDGYVSADRVGRLMPRFKPSYVDELVSRGLWADDLPGGYTVRNFTAYQRDREYWLKEREKAAERQRVARANKEAAEKARKEAEGNA